MKATENRVNHYHKVVDCQYACPAHTPVPEYIRLIAAGRYTEAYMVNWESNVFPGILGRVCDRPCEPACRRGRDRRGRPRSHPGMGRGAGRRRGLAQAVLHPLYEKQPEQEHDIKPPNGQPTKRPGAAKRRQEYNHHGSPLGRWRPTLADTLAGRCAK